MDGYLAGGHIVSRLAGLLLKSTEDMFRDWSKLGLWKRKVCPRRLGGLVRSSFRDAVFQVAAVLGCLGLGGLRLLRIGLSCGSCCLRTCFPLGTCDDSPCFVCCRHLRHRPFDCGACLRMACAAILFFGSLRGSPSASASFVYAVGKVSRLFGKLLLRLLRSDCAPGIV